MFWKLNMAVHRYGKFKILLNNHILLIESNKNLIIIKHKVLLSINYIWLNKWSQLVYR